MHLQAHSCRLGHTLSYELHSCKGGGGGYRLSQHGGRYFQVHIHCLSTGEEYFHRRVGTVVPLLTGAASAPLCPSYARRQHASHQLFSA